jgi:pimeloyl-ACP methyl ester carboxylesterase
MALRALVWRLIVFIPARIKQTARLLTVLSAFFSSSAFAAPAHEDVSFTVSLRTSGSASIHADVYNNPKNIGVTILAVHGYTERGSMWQPLTNAIFADNVLGFAVKRVIAIDMPLHGGSGAPSLPSPTKFGDLLIDDNLSVVVQSIDALRQLGKGAQVIMGHSMGGLEVQAAQEALLAQNSSLAKHGIFGAILVDAVPARGTQWTQLFAPDITPFIVTTPELGTFVSVPAALGPFGGGFTTLSNTIAPNAPSSATFVANGWSSPEPITTTLQLVGTTAPLWRPFVRQNAFALRNGTVLSVIAGSQDVLTPIVDQPILYTYLSGLPATGVTLYRPVVADDAVHSVYISNPTEVLAALRNGVIH